MATDLLFAVLLFLAYGSVDLKIPKLPGYWRWLQVPAGALIIGFLG